MAYHIIENPIMMTYEEICEKYDGAWVLSCHCEFTEGKRLIKGAPCLVVDSAAEDVPIEVLNMFDDGAVYGKLMSCNLYAPLLGSLVMSSRRNVSDAE